MYSTLYTVSTIEPDTVTELAKLPKAIWLACDKQFQQLANISNHQPNLAWFLDILQAYTSNVPFLSVFPPVFFFWKYFCLVLNYTASLRTCILVFVHLSVFYLSPT